MSGKEFFCNNLATQKFPSGAAAAVILHSAAVETSPEILIFCDPEDESGKRQDLWERPAPYRNQPPAPEIAPPEIPERPLATDAAGHLATGLQVELGTE